MTSETTTLEERQMRVSDREARRKLLSAIREAGGPVTMADLVVRTGLQPMRVEPELRQIVMDFDCKLEVDDDGRITYDFGRRPALRDTEPWWRPVLRKSYAAFRVFFKVMISVVLVTYFVIKADKKLINEIENLPLDANEEENEKE